MKNTNFLFSLLVVVLLFSCKSHDTKNKAILRAEALLISFPDSASHLLASLSHPEKLSSVDYAAWCLIYTQAQLKLHTEFRSDSLIMNSVNYYKNSNLPAQAGKAYYLSGYINHRLKKNTEAMKAFKQAEFFLNKTGENKFKGLLDYYIAEICSEDELYTYSLQYYKKSLNYFKLSNDLNFQAYDYRDISNMYFRLHYPFDSVMYYSNQALKLSKSQGDSINYYFILSRQGEMLYNRNYALSNKFIHQGYRFFPDRRSYYAAFLSYTYSMLNQRDSAQYYLNISLSRPLNIKTKVITYMAAAYASKNEGNNDKAFHYFEKAYLFRDSVFEQSIQSQLYRIDKQYDLSKKEAENSKLKINTRNQVIVIGLLTIIVLIGLIIFLILSNRYKKKQIEHRAEKLQMEYDINVEKVENNQKKELLLSKLQNRIENTLHFNRLQMGLLQNEKLDDFKKKISEQAILSETDWEYYMLETNHIFDSKISNLSGVNPQLTQSDLIVITLICLRVDISNCCSLLNMKKNAMYHRRKIIKDRIGISKDIDLEDWIHDYLEL